MLAGSPTKISNSQTQTEEVQHELQLLRGGPAFRVAFRFCFFYFGLYCLATQVITSLFPILNVDIPDPATLRPVRQVVFWTASHVFHVTTPMVYSGSGSGDKPSTGVGFLPAGLFPHSRLPFGPSWTASGKTTPLCRCGSTS